MNSSEEHFEQQQQPPGELQALRANSQATVAELRQFLSELKGRSPQDVMGTVAESSLVRSIVTACLGCMVVLVVFTAGPWLLTDSSASPVPVTGDMPAAETTPAVAGPADDTVEPAEAPVQAAPDLQKAAGHRPQDLEEAPEWQGGLPRMVRRPIHRGEGAHDNFK